ncbi:MAG: hypothetical protein LLF76_12450 [Planctomycetaceae bacterium]|nr:hypothetical protein [Planctomycetaceae bacterium]
MPAEDDQANWIYQVLSDWLGLTAWDLYSDKQKIRSEQHVKETIGQGTYTKALRRVQWLSESTPQREDKIRELISVIGTHLIGPANHFGAEFAEEFHLNQQLFIWQNIASWITHWRELHPNHTAQEEEAAYSGFISIILHLGDVDGHLKDIAEGHI